MARAVTVWIALAVALVVLLFAGDRVALAHPLPPELPSLPPPAQLGKHSAKIAPDVVAAMKTLPLGETLPVIVTLTDQAGPAQLAAVPPGANRAARLQNVVEQLQATAAAGQQSIKPLLNLRQAEGQVKNVEYFWIFNGLAMSASPQIILELAGHPEVKTITLDAALQAPPPPAPAELELMAVAETNLQNINVPELWKLGITGQGIVVANLDSGVDITTQPDLAASWRGGDNSWYDPYGENATPKDFNGHGTATMGIMVGSEHNGRAFGVAPDAQWISAKIFNNAGSGTIQALVKSYQWILNPDGDPTTPDAPHVVNNSWTLSSASECDYQLQTMVQNLRAAGILPIFSAGNSSDITYSPANYPESFAVGAVNNSDVIWVDSSRGLSACDGTPFPEMVAPGVGIYTTDSGGYFFDYTGTSMAAPHVAGALALLLSASPNLTVDQQEAALLDGVVDLGAPGIDTTYGKGRLEVLESLLTLGDLDLSVSTAASAQMVLVNRPVTFSHNVSNRGPGDASGVVFTHTVTSGSAAAAFVTAATDVSIGPVSASQGSCALSGASVVVCNLGAIDANASATVNVTITPLTSGITLTNTSTVSSAEVDFNSQNTTTSTASPVLEKAPFAVFLPIVLN